MNAPLRVPGTVPPAEEKPAAWGELLLALLHLVLLDARENFIPGLLALLMLPVGILCLAWVLPTALGVLWAIAEALFRALL